MPPCPPLPPLPPVPLAPPALHVGPREALCRQVASTVAMLLIASLGTGLIAFVGNFNGRGMLNGFLQGRLPFPDIAPDSLLGLIVTAVCQLLIALPIILGNVLIFLSVPLLADR